LAAPQQPPAVVLVGFMGAGKSAVGRELAARLGLPYLDTDEAITAAAGSIPEIFAARGEAGFRAIEAETVVREIDALREAPKVLALGGGAVLSGEVRAALAGSAPVVWLAAPAAELWRRVTADPVGQRPLAQDEEGFTALLAARESLYREVATLVVETGGRGADDVATQLAEQLRGEEKGRRRSPSRQRTEGAA
jgi:shikimate kinase